MRRSRLRGIQSAEPMRKQRFGLVAVAEADDPRMLEIATEDRAHPDVLD